MKKPEILNYIKPEEYAIVFIVILFVAIFIVGAVMGIADFLGNG